VSVTLEGLVSHATWVQNPRSGGGTYDPLGQGFPWRIVIHEIQGDDRLSMIQSHPAPPHLWYDPVSRDLHQTVPFSRSAFALWQGNGVYTNRARAIQVELAGFSEYEPVETLQQLTNIAEDVIVPICQWVAMVSGQIDLNNVTGPFTISGSASEFAPQRFSEHLWTHFNGVCGHVHVPGNDHWDPGAMNLQRIAQHAALIVGGMLSPGGDDELTEDQARQLNDLAGPYKVDVYQIPDGRWISVTAGQAPPAGSVLAKKDAPPMWAWAAEAVTTMRQLSSRVTQLEQAVAARPSGSGGPGPSASAIVDEFVRRLAS
jgi:hypothetical protein